MRRAQHEAPTRRSGAPPARPGALRALGLRVRALRQARGLTLEGLAEQSGLDFKHIQKIEAGHLDVRVGTLLRLAAGLGAPPGFLLDAPRGGPDDVYPARPPADPRGLVRAGEKLEVDPCSGRSRRLRPETVAATVGRRIAGTRRARGWTQRFVASRAGVTVQWVRRVEAGANVTIRTLVRFADALGVDPAALIARVPAPGR